MKNAFAGFLNCVVLTMAASFAPAIASVLGDRSGILQPGSWAELSTTGYTHALLSTGSDYILNYSNSACWDPSSGKLLFMGKGAGGAETKGVIYTESTNSWENFYPVTTVGFGHGYDHNALDPARGEFYFGYYNSTIVARYLIAAKTWQNLPDMPGTPACCYGLVWFPEMQGLIYAGGGTIYSYKRAANTWSTLATSVPMGEYHNVAEYDPVHKVVFVGGGNGSSDLYKIDSSGKRSKIADCPSNIGIYSGLITVDPSSGELLVIGRNGKFWAYRYSSDEWRPLPNPPSALLYNEGGSDNAIYYLVAAPISSYNVNLFLTPNKVFVYKHSNSAAVKTQCRPVKIANAGPALNKLFDIRGRSVGRASSEIGRLAMGIYIEKITAGSSHMNKCIPVIH